MLPAASRTFVTDFDVFGLVGIRAISEREDDCQLVADTLGSIQAPLNRTPDITIRFVSKINTDDPIRLVGGHDCGSSRDAFFVVRGKNKSHLRLQVPFEQIGGTCEITCESGAKNLPLLIEIINLTALQKQALPLHASAFEYEGKGVLCAGWAQGGKTETLLGFMARGARYIGDEWVYVQQDGICGIPEPMHVWDWHVDELPDFRNRLDWRDRVRMRSLRIAAGSIDAARKVRPVNRLLPQKTTRRLVALLNRQRYLEVLPQDLFRRPVTDPHGKLDHLLFVMSHDSPEYRVEPIKVEDAILALAPALEQERSHLLEKYRMFRFAFPGKSNPRLEQAAAVELDLLRQRLGHLPCHLVLHPYPMSPTSLFDCITNELF
ncbi:MAG: hypothetical protein Fues2KO_42670 [Fuerstiella sp.]